MHSLFDISSELIHLYEAIDLLEEDPENDVLQGWFDELLQDTLAQRDRKLDNYASLIAELDARAQARKQEANRLLNRARVDSNAVSRLKLNLKQFFETQGLKKVETSRYRLSLATTGGKQPLVIDQDYPASQIPDAFCRISRELDPEAIRTALEAGEALPFAQLGERQQQIRIS